MCLCTQFIKLGKEALLFLNNDKKDANLRKKQQRAIYLLLFTHIYLYFSGYVCTITFVNYFVVKFCIFSRIFK